MIIFLNYNFFSIYFVKICFTFFSEYNKYEFYLYENDMADINPTAANNSANQVSSTDQASEAKKPLFGGSQEVFDNLEKFERISNPTDDNFDFDFSDITSEQSTEENKEDWNNSSSSFDVTIDESWDVAQEQSNTNDVLWDFDFNGVWNNDQQAEDSQVVSNAAEITIDLDVPAEEKKEGATDNWDFNFDIDIPSEASTTETNEEVPNNSDDISNFEFNGSSDNIESQETTEEKQELSEVDLDTPSTEVKGETPAGVENDIQNFDIDFDTPSSETSTETTDSTTVDEEWNSQSDIDFTENNASLENSDWANAETEEVVEEVEEWDEDTDAETEEVVEEVEEWDEDADWETEEVVEEVEEWDEDTDAETEEVEEWDKDTDAETEEVEEIEEWDEDTDAETEEEVEEWDEDTDDDTEEIEEEVEEWDENEGNVVEDENDDTKKDDAIETEEDTTGLSQLVIQFKELVNLSKQMLKLEKDITNNSEAENHEVEIIWNNTEKNMTRYLVSLNEDNLTSIMIKKIEKDYARDEENEHTLEFTTEEERLNLIVNVDWFKLYEELIDLQDPVKQLQVWDKMKKFAFLFQWKISELEEKYEELKERKEKMKVFRDIFRNF